MTAAVDAVVADLARSAAIEAAGDADAVGEIQEAGTDAGYTSMRFAATLPGYRGWSWTVILADLEGSPTVCEAYLLPGEDSLLAPEWVPWAERVQPGDLEPAMVLPLIADDWRLAPGFTATGDPDLDQLAIWELGLGRERVLAPEGREAAAERWDQGPHGSSAALITAAGATCSTCAFFVPLTGSMRMAFGACANEWSPADGTVVSVGFGCGAHSQTDSERRSSEWPAPDPIMDTDAIVPLDLQSVPAPEPATVVLEAGETDGQGAVPSETAVDNRDLAPDLDAGLSAEEAPTPEEAPNPEEAPAG